MLASAGLTPPNITPPNWALVYWNAAGPLSSLPVFLWPYMEYTLAPTLILLPLFAPGLSCTCSRTVVR